MPKTTFTKEECMVWKKDKDHNPRTGRAIKKDAKQGVFVELAKQCAELDKPKDARKKRGVPRATTGVSKVPVTKEVQTAYDAYCRCLMKVRPKATGKGGPYGICTSSVLRKKQIQTQPGFCDFNFEEFDANQLLAYGAELEGRKKWDWAMTKKARSGDRSALIKEITSLHRKMKKEAVAKTAKKTA
jgi:hypothetical protein